VVLGSKGLKPAIEKGVESVKKADGAIRLSVGLAAAGLVLTVCTLVIVALLTVRVSSGA
jgi:hypothetical protein